MGLFDVCVPEGIIYSNRNEGGRLPKNEEIIEKIWEYLERPDRRSLGGEGAPKDVPERGIAERGCT
jgi:hypothetical protein